MSEFRQATAHVEELEARLAELQQSVADDIVSESSEESFRFIMTTVNGDVDAMMEKFRARCSMVDPITNQPRFGPKMLAKVQDLLHRYDNVRLTLEEDAPLRLQLQTKLSQITEQHATRQQAEEKREEAVNEAQRVAELAKEQEKQRLVQEAEEREVEQQREEQERIQALAVAAQKKREQRVQERAEQERQRQLEEQERERLNASIPHGKEGLEMAIAMLREATDSETRFRQSLQKLLAVVRNICQSPENAAFRHIPRDNAHFHADLGQYPGGHQCLLAMGFKELQQGDETQPRNVFVLEEPDLSEDLDAWSSWFDELKELQSLVESKI
ncbi:hypothetical protein PInf_024331 [Phytophthora infestans]|nr:hypothetical protein PInf_027630 [Phytophthora infestans]KAI9988070.1 hypothetical protein PInf_024331 [Phytophthora infestans]